MKSKFLYNNKSLEHYRKKLRNNQTKAEKRLWYWIGNRQIKGFRFFRQYGAGPYILDFYCPKVRLAIELDGSHHSFEENMLYDKERSDYLKSINIRVIRFWNNEVFENIDGVLEVITNEVYIGPPLRIRGG